MLSYFLAKYLFVKIGKRTHLCQSQLHMLYFQILLLPQKQLNIDPFKA